MRDEIAREIDQLKSKVTSLENHLEDPRKLEAMLLDACGGLLALLEETQSDKPAGEEEAQIRSFQETINAALHSIESTQKNLHDSEKRYRTIVESQTELICRFTPLGVLTFFNDAFRRYFSEVDAIAIGWNILPNLPEESRKLVQENIANLNLLTPEAKVEFSLPMPGGEVRWLQWTAQGSFDNQGALVEILAVGHDITDLKQARIVAEQFNRELSALHTATSALLTTLDPEALLGRILDSAISAIPAADRGMIHLIAQDTGQLEMRASVGYSDPRIRRVRIPGAVGYVARSVRERTPLLVNNIHADPANLTGFFTEIQDVQSAVVAPLILKGQVLGAVSLESTHLSAFSQTDLRLLTSFATTATAAIQNARLHAEVQKLAITDSLTGLYNRRGLFELGQREVERSRRYKRPLVAVLMDVDHFKFINDIYGHTAGDLVLQTVAKRCNDNLRRIDILGRLGGDEFAILLPETDMFTASNVAERVRQCVAETPIATEKTPVNVSVSMGVARATSATPDLDILISRADAAMYVAKREGRNRVEFG
ncbi:MAG: diguanylate cyclase [Chloroflexi bacterium]|nr:diguanylate cyclase [Chloroflexota bacterium]